MANPLDFLNELFRNDWRPPVPDSLQRDVNLDNVTPPQTYLMPYSPTEQGTLPIYAYPGQQGEWIQSPDIVMQMLKNPNGMNGDISVAEVLRNLRMYQENKPSY